MFIGACWSLSSFSLFLYEWRIALYQRGGHPPVAVSAAGLVLYSTGATINTMILAGLVIALGAVVDDAIIDIENIVRRLREKRTKPEAISVSWRVILEASSRSAVQSSMRP